MKKIIILLLLVFAAFNISCSKSLKEEDIINTLKDKEDFYSQIADQYSTEESEGSYGEDEYITPPGFDADLENDYDEEIEDIERFNYDSYKAIISEINTIITAKQSKEAIFSNLINYETGNFEAVYTLHKVLEELDDDSKAKLFERIRNDDTFKKFFKYAPNFAKSTIIAEIFQNLIFAKED